MAVEPQPDTLHSRQSDPCTPRDRPRPGRLPAPGGPPHPRTGSPGLRQVYPCHLPAARPLTPRAACCPPASCGAPAAAGCCPSCRRPPRPLRSPRPPRHPGARGGGAGSGWAGPAAQGRGRERRATRGAARAARPTDTAAPWAPLRAEPTRAPAPGAAAVSPPRPAARPPGLARPPGRAPPTVPARAHARPAALTPPRAFSPARSEPCAHTPPRSPHLHAADTDTHSLPPPGLTSPCGSHSGPPSLGSAGKGDVQVSRFPHAILHHPRPSLHLHSCNLNHRLKAVPSSPKHPYTSLWGPDL